MTHSKLRITFLSILLLTLAYRIYIIWLNVWPINGDEAQYFSWAKHLAFGYYSKPPMIAWLIALTTKLFGNGPVGLRIASPLAYTVTAIFIYLSAKKLFDEKTGFWCGVLFLLIPGATFSSSIISTDPFLLMFWSIAFFGLIMALKQQQLSLWIFCAFFLGLAFYAKYAAILFTLSLFVYLLLSSENRFLLKKSGPYWVLILPFIMLIPNLWWNYQNHFASIEAVKNNADLSGNLFHFSNLLNFILSQFAVFGPVLFAALLIYLFQIHKYIKQERFLLLSVFTFVTLAIMTLESFLSRAHANWSAPAYIAASILVVAILVIKKQRFWLWFALILHFLLAYGFMHIQSIVRFIHAPMDKEMTIISWPKASIQINSLETEYPEAKILVNNRMLLTQIMYFGKIPLEKMFAWNPNHLIRSQYDLVTHMAPQKGKNFLFFSYQPYPDYVAPYFETMKPLPTITLITLDGKPLNLYVFWLQDFKGY